MSLKEDIILSLEYNQSCDYNKSEKNILINEVNQDINISIDIINKNVTPLPPNSKRHHLDEIYFNDILEIRALLTTIDSSPKPIQGGSVEFFFFDNYLKENVSLGIGKVNNDGIVGVQHIPHHNGYYYARFFYDNNNHIQEKFSDNYPIILKNIPTDLTFPTLPKTHMKEAVDLIAYVNDIDGRKLNYGTVTFLTYKVHSFDGAFAGVEKVIGDPVPLDENGMAKISYSPKQSYVIDYVFYDSVTGDLYHTYKTENQKFISYTDNKLFLKTNDIAKKYYIQENDNGIQDIILYYEPDKKDVKTTEYLKAHYNFGTALYNPNPTIYGNQFKYYKDSNAYQELSLIQNNTMIITVSELYYKDGVPKLKPLTLNEDLSYNIGFSSILVLEATLYDANGEQITDFDNDIEINFLIKDSDNKEQKHIGILNNDGYILINDTEVELNNKHSFVQKIGGWNGGYYTIYGYSEYLETSSDTLLIYCTQTKDTINISTPIFNNQSNINSFNTNENIKISSNISLEQTPLNYLDGQEIIFIEHCTSDNKENIIHKGQIKNGIGSIQWTPSTPGDYEFTATINDTKINNIQYYGQTSKPISVKIRDKITCDITYDKIEKAPGLIIGNVQINNIFKTETPNIYLCIKKDNTIIYDQHSYESNFNFKQTDLNYGKYIIQIIINNKVIKEENFTIEKRNLTSQLIEPSTSKIPTNSLQTITLEFAPVITNEEQQILKKYNKIIKIPKSEVEENIKILIGTTTLEEYTPTVLYELPNGNIQVSIKIPMSIKGNYYIGAKHLNEHSNYNTFESTIADAFVITTETKAGNIIKTKENNDKHTLYFKIGEENNQTINHNYYIIKTNITTAKGNQISYLTITNIFGEGAIKFDGEDKEWENRIKTDTICTPIPYINSIIQTIQQTEEQKQLSTLQSLIIKLKQVDNYKNIYIGDSCIDIENSPQSQQFLINLLSQIKESNYTTFFTTYDGTPSYIER